MQPVERPDVDVATPHIYLHNDLEPRLAMERRLSIRLLAYWEKKRSGRTMPTEQDIDSEDLHDLWDHCFLIHTHDLDKPEYRYSYLGEAIMAACCLGNLAADAVLSKRYPELLKSCCPLVDEGEFRNVHNELVRYRQCLLPLGRNGKVEAILGGVRFRVFAGA